LFGHSLTLSVTGSETILWASRSIDVKPEEFVKAQQHLQPTAGGEATPLRRHHHRPPPPCGIVGITGRSRKQGSVNHLGLIFAVMATRALRSFGHRALLPRAPHALAAAAAPRVSLASLAPPSTGENATLPVVDTSLGAFGPRVEVKFDTIAACVDGPHARALLSESMRQLLEVATEATSRIHLPAQCAAPIACRASAVAGLLGALTQPGDAVLCIGSPDEHTEQRMAERGLTVQCMNLKPPRPHAGASKCLLNSAAGWSLDLDALTDAIGPDTRILMLGTPQSLLGKAFSRSELDGLARVLAKHPHVTVIADESDHLLTMDPASYTPLCSVPGLQERTATVFESTAGAESNEPHDGRFRVVLGANHILDRFLQRQMHDDHALLAETERAIKAVRCQLEGGTARAKALQHKRDRVFKLLQAAGLPPVLPQVGGAMVADCSGLPAAQHPLFDEGPCTGDLDGTSATCTWLLKEAGVAAAPVGMSDSGHLVRFQFALEDRAFERFHGKLDEFRLHQEYALMRDLVDSPNPDHEQGTFLL